MDTKPVIKNSVAGLTGCLVPVLLSLSVLAAVHSAEVDVAPLIESACIHCHDADTETGLNFETLSHDLSDPVAFRTWESVFDRVADGQMPPESEDRPDPEALASALNMLERGLRSESAARQEVEGRVKARRLTKLEFGYTLQDLLLIEGDVTSGIPDEAESGSFDNVGASQRLSAIHMESYLDAADRALALAIRTERNPFRRSENNYNWLQEWHDKPLNLGGSITRKRDSGSGIVLFRDADYLTVFKFASFNPYSGPSVAGTYRLTAEVAAIQTDEVLTAKIIAKSPSGGARLLKAVDLLPGETQVVDVEAYLEPGVLPYLTFVDPAEKIGGVFSAGGAQNYKGPGLAIHSQAVEGPLADSWPPASTRRLLHGVELDERSWILQIANGVVGGGGSNDGFRVRLTKDAQQHLSDIVRRFAALAFRRPVVEEEIEAFSRLACAAIEEERPFIEAVKIPLRSMLASPQFLLFGGEPGKLDDFALANRLAYFLWKSMPDEQLFTLAAEGKLSDPVVLAGQVDRMLADSKANRFVVDFLGQWLRLNKVNVTTPDDGLYPEFDEVLSQSIPQETQAFFTELIQKNESLSKLIDCDYTMLNRRLAEHYGIESVQGQAFQRVELPDDSPRGGILTQAAILKTTANGTNTSPVMRGNFVLTNVLGTPPSPPPPNVGSIEPDTRGRTTIREILAAHREIESCNQCHREIDPPGFALESFDPVGGYRTAYRVSGGEYTVGGIATKLPPKPGRAVDASGVTSEGVSFSGIQEFKKLLMKRKPQVARNFISKLAVYATGAEIQFADRDEIEAILARASENDYPVRDILHEVVASKMFRHK